MSEEYNPNATDGDGDGFVQDGTKFERPVEAVEAPAEEPEADTQEVITAAVTGVVAEEAPALAPVGDGVIGSSTTKKTAKTAPKKAESPKTETVAVYSERNLSWQGVGKISKGYNFVSKELAAKWLTLDPVREAKPEEVKSNLG